MDFVEVEAKTYEDAVRKACEALNAQEKDLDIEVTEVDTKGILGLLGSKKVRIAARIRNTPETPEDYGKKFLAELAQFYGVPVQIEIAGQNERVMYSIETPDEEPLVGKDGEVIEALQHLVKLAIAKRYKENMKLLLDVNGYRERRKKTIITMAKRLADKVRKEGRPIKTKPLNPYERRIIHTLFKGNSKISTHSEGEGHTKKVIIAPSGPTNTRPHARRPR
jgi:spoIIIJ-associated protein